MSGPKEPSTIAPARPAATVIPLRETEGRIEIYMLQRHSAGYLGDFWVFPGGRVDEHDYEPSIAARCTGLSAAQANDLLDVEDGALAYWVAAIRECFEECGLLLTSDPVAESVEHLRRDLHQGELSFAELLESMDWRPDAGRLIPWAHWVTPEMEKKRFDTRFFITTVPDGQDPVPDGVELADGMWITAAEALERRDRKDMKLLFPTFKNLEKIAGFDSLEVLLETTRRTRPVTVAPRMVREGGRVRILLPEED